MNCSNFGSVPKRPVFVLRGRSTHLELAVLLHLASKYKRALQELIFCSETVPSEEAGSTTAQQLTVLMEKTRVQLAIDI
jgi:hypothetical protein